MNSLAKKKKKKAEKLLNLGEKTETREIKNVVGCTCIQKSKRQYYLQLLF